MTTTEFVLIGHAVDLRRPSNTARLVARVLQRARIEVIDAHNGREPLAARSGRSLVLHPDGRPLTAADASADLRVLVPDGTWKQVRRMIHRAPTLVATELVRVDASNRLDRRARESPRAGLLSTYEAVARAAGILESTALEKQMLKALREVVDRMLRLRGR